MAWAIVFSSSMTATVRVGMPTTLGPIQVRASAFRVEIPWRLAEVLGGVIGFAGWNYYGSQG